MSTRPARCGDFATAASTSGYSPMCSARPRSMIEGVNIEQWWPKLSSETRDWLVEHNGEPLDAAVGEDIAAATGGSPDPRWWSGKPSDGLTDEAFDWIEARANDENPDT
jgi:hypothetical protein